MAYRVEPRELVVELDLPTPETSVPQLRQVTYVQKTQSIKEVSRPASDVDATYRSLVAQLVIVYLDRCFSPLLNSVCERVIVNAHLHAVDPATGRDVHPCLVSVSTSRERFNELDLRRVDPTRCLKERLRAELSSHPLDLEPVEPFLEFDKAKWRIGDPAEALADLESRLNLVTIHHARFEDLVTDLLRAMGLISYATPRSGDEGVDTVAFYRDIVSGGEFAVQAKRYTKKALPVTDVRELAGVVENKRATRGFLVTTSWASGPAKDFARSNNRIKIIEGGELKYLLKEHLDIDAVIPSRVEKPRG